MSKVLKRNLDLFSLVIFSFLLYLPSLRGFFQHDEWSTFAELIVLRSKNLINTISYLFWPDVAHYTPIERIGFYLQFLIFKLNFFGYIFVSLILNSIIVLLFYGFATLIFKNKKMAFVTSCVFLISSASFQAVTWVGASMGTELATLFGILSAIFFIKYLQKKNKLNLGAWVVFYFLSMLSKEIAIFLPICFGFYYLIFRGKRRFDFKCLLYPFITFLSYIFMRVLFFFLPHPQNTQFLVSKTQSIFEIIYNFLSFPFKVVSQSVVPVRVLISISQFAGRILNIHNEATIETTVSEILTYVIFAVLFAAGLFVVRRNKQMGKIIVFGFLFVAINSFIYAFSPGRTGLITFPDSRNLYFPMIGICFILSGILFYCYKKASKIGFLLTVLFILINVINFNVEFANLSAIGTMRQKVVSQIKDKISYLPPKSVIYTESDTAFYGMSDSDKILPFETGFGQIMLIEYQDKVNFPNVFFENAFLQELLDQGYKESGNRAFGYFRNFNDLKSVVVQDNLPIENVIGLKYTLNGNLITDITKKTQESLLNFKAMK